MYTQKQLQGKSLPELKEIGWQLNALPDGDRRLRKNWIRAIEQAAEQAGDQAADEFFASNEVNAAEVESEMSQSAIEPVAETFPGVNDKVQAPESVTCWQCEGDGFLSDGGVIWDCSHCDSGLIDLSILEEKSSEVLLFYYGTADAAEAFKGLQNKQKEEPIGQAAEKSPGVGVAVSEAIVPVVANSPGVESELASKFGRIVYPRPAAKVEPEMSQSAIGQAAENFTGLRSVSDRNPILTGLALSDRFLATYPPYFGEIHYKAEVTGQLNLLEPDIEDEPPDPDDFDSLDAFREAIALLDAQNPEPLAVSLDSMCEWAPCPDEWFEPKAEILPLKASSMSELPEHSEVMELLRADESSDTLDFFIPTFGSLGDRFKGSDEPPDTGIFARLPKPKPPKFPPQVASWTQVSRKLDANQPQVSRKSAQVSPSQLKSTRHPDTIPILFRRVAAGTSNQPARSPPGGDA